VKTLLRLSLKKKTLVEGRTRSGQVVFELLVTYVWETSAAGLPGSMLYFLNYEK
jgi:hypothetical protein